MSAREGLNLQAHCYNLFHFDVPWNPSRLEQRNGRIDRNPPFLGGKDIAKALGDTFLESLKAIVSNKKGSLDLAAYFVHRMSRLVRDCGTFGLIGTMALVKGGTREGGLADLLTRNFRIIAATRPRKWPGAAAVHFITAVLAKGEFEVTCRLDDQDVPLINSYLKPRKEPSPPQALQPRMVWSRGTTFLGEGFMLTPEERKQLLDADESVSGVIRKLMGGSDLVKNPSVKPTRFVIDFGEMPEEEAKQFAPAYDRIVETVKPQRDKLTRQIHEHCFWKHWDKRKDLYEATATIPRAVAFSMVTKYVTYGVVDDPGEIVFSDRLGVLANESFGLFATMQSRVNESWVTEYSNRRGETLQISIGGSLGTYPFPDRMEELDELAAIGETYFTLRRSILTQNKEGLTDTYNRFHDPHEKSAEIEKLRELHAAMDRAVLEAYGWDDLARTATCDFLLDYEEEDDDESGRSSRRRKPWRLCWPDDFRDEALARLLELNEQRHKEELLSGRAAELDQEKMTRRKPPAADHPPLPGMT